MRKNMHSGIPKVSSPYLLAYCAACDCSVSSINRPHQWTTASPHQSMATGPGLSTLPTFFRLPFESPFGVLGGSSSPYMRRSDSAIVPSSAIIAGVVSPGMPVRLLVEELLHKLLGLTNRCLHPSQGELRKLRHAPVHRHPNGGRRRAGR